MGARKMVTIIHQDYSIKVSECVHILSMLGTKLKVGAVIGSLSTNFSGGLNRTLLKLADTVVSEGDASGRLELWSTGP